jgi:hypothetical protein
MKKSSLFLALGFMFFFACTQEQGPVDPDPDPNPGGDGISFSGDIQPLFDRSCSSCHNEFHILNLKPCCSFDNLTKNGYVDTNNPENSELYKRIKHPNPSMPPSGTPLSEQEVQTILTWIEEGAINN